MYIYTLVLTKDSLFVVALFYSDIKVILKAVCKTANDDENAPFFTVIEREQGARMVFPAS
jgi:hypothetical protein